MEAKVIRLETANTTPSTPPPLFHFPKQPEAGCAHRKEDRSTNFAGQRVCSSCLVVLEET
jgi:hypothetical protein